jgi:hypothetical protein
MIGRTMTALEALRIEAGLRAMGLLYGSSADLRDIVAHAADEAGAVRAYILRGRPHLLSCYDVDSLVAMVLAACDAPDEGESTAMIEQFHPR